MWVSISVLLRYFCKHVGQWTIGSLLKSLIHVKLSMCPWRNKLLRHVKQDRIDRSVSAKVSSQKNYCTKLFAYKKFLWTTQPWGIVGCRIDGATHLISIPSYTLLKERLQCGDLKQPPYYNASKKSSCLLLATI